jgi:hypothetical protein
MTINSEHVDKDRLYKRDGSLLKISVENNALSDLADKWFMENAIFSFNIKSSAWNKICKTIDMIIGKDIASFFEINPDLVKYSKKCLCSCGCSPGFNVKLPLGHKYCSYNLWIVPTITPEDIITLENVIKKNIPNLYKKDLIKNEESYKKV